MPFKSFFVTLIVLAVLGAVAMTAGVFVGYMLDNLVMRLPV